MQPFEQRRQLAHVPGNISFSEKLQRPLVADDIKILQVNMGHRCNLTCKHCHVQAGPHRTEAMDRIILEKCLQTMADNPISTIDITGGAPEMNPHLGWFIQEAARLGRRLLVRSNLLILRDKDYRHFIDLYATYQVEVVSSLPDYRATRTNRQRGPKVFEGVVEVMRELNTRGYGQPGGKLILDLVYNPVGAYLPGPQLALEYEYRKRLADDHGIVFSHLFCITNAPVGRYLEYLVRSENYEEYMTELINAFNRTAIEKVMCRDTLSVGWDGKLYDCDFNQMLELTVNHGAPAHIDIFDFEKLKSRNIVVANHCYACTAGAGSSCQGVLEESGGASMNTERY